MGLPIRADKEKTSTFTAFHLEKEGIYKVFIVKCEDKTGTKGKSEGYKYHNLQIQFENGTNKFENIYFLNKEGDIIPNGENTLLDLHKILANFKKDDEDYLEKIKQIDSTKMINQLIKYKVPFYVETKNSIYEGKDQTNINWFTPVVGTLKEAEKMAETVKKDIISLSKDVKKTSSKQQEEDDDDDL